MTRARVYCNDSFAGWLTQNDAGYTFCYDDAYRADTSSHPVSLSFPLTKRDYQNPTLFPFFKHLIPEGWLFELNARTLKIDPHDEFGMLLATGKDCIGAVSVLPEGDHL